MVIFLVICALQIACRKQQQENAYSNKNLYSQDSGKKYYQFLDDTVQYAIADDGTVLSINIQTPPGILLGTSRPVIIFTHGTSDNPNSEHNNLEVSSYTKSFLSLGFIVVNFNFYGNSYTRLNDDGKHLTTQYAQVVDYLFVNADKYHVNRNAVIATGVSGSGANAVGVAVAKKLFGCFLICSGRNISIESKEPAILYDTLSFGGIQTQSDQGFGSYRFIAADVGLNSTYDVNYNIIDIKAKVPDPGDNSYSTAWGDCGLKETYSHLKTKYGVKIMSPASYVTVISASSEHCPGGNTWDNAIKIIPKQMLNDRGIFW